MKTFRLLSQSYLLILLLLLIVTSSFANDSAVEGVGGALHPMKEHSSIRMVSERVVVDLWPEKAEVDCRFTFKNNGPSTTVRMGFPESGWNAGDRGFRHFATWVDGQRVKATIEGREEFEGHWQRWRVKRVRFGAGQMRQVRVRYGANAGGVSDGSRFFKYQLGTGASWKDTIGKADVQVRLHSFPWYVNVTATPKPHSSVLHIK